MVTTELHEHSWNITKGKIAVVIMTFSGDKGCLEQCLRGLEEQKNKGYNIEVFILDDANSPLDPDDYTNYNYKRTYFLRNKNLNGTQCSHGMLIEFLRIARTSQAEYIMKVDCDMYIRTLDNFLKPLQVNENLVLGFKLNPRMNYVAGVTYILPTKGLYNAVRDFHKWYKLEQQDIKEWAAHCPEDWAITRCVCFTNNYTLYQWLNSIHPETWLLAPFNYKEVNSDGSINPLCLSRFQLYDFVNFGNRHEIADTTNSRMIAALCMKKYIDYDLIGVLDQV